MKENDRNFEANLVDARKVLDPLWKGEIHNKGCRSRGWGSRTNKDNPLGGSNITMATEDEAVIVNLKDRELQVHGYSKNPNTKLGKEVEALLKDKGLLK
jgi:hypothetical protein